MSNSGKLRQERASFANVSVPLSKAGGEGTEELPFIVGIVDDVRGNAERAVKKRAELVDRKFDKISRYTLDDKLAELTPGLDYSVKCTLPNTGEDTLQVKLDFREMKDFEPKRVAQQIQPLNDLLKLRELLLALKNRAAARPETRKALEKLMTELMADSSRK